MKGQKNDTVKEANVCVGRTDGENPWPKFGKPLIGPPGGGEPVEEVYLTWLRELEVK